MARLTGRVTPSRWAAWPRHERSSRPSPEERHGSSQTHPERKTEHKSSCGASSPSPEAAVRSGAARWPSSGCAAGRVGELREVGPPLAVLTLHVVTCSRVGGTFAQTPALGAATVHPEKLRQAPRLTSQTLSLPGPNGALPPPPSPPSHKGALQASGEKGRSRLGGGQGGGPLTLVGWRDGDHLSRELLIKIPGVCL